MCFQPQRLVCTSVRMEGEREREREERKREREGEEERKRECAMVGLNVKA